MKWSWVGLTKKHCAVVIFIDNTDNEYAISSIISTDDILDTSSMTERFVCISPLRRM